LYIDLMQWQKNGLSNLNYKLMKMTDEAENTTQYLVDLMKLEDEKKYPELFKTEGLKFDWKKDRRLITDKYEKLRIEILDFAQQPLTPDSFEMKEPVRFTQSQVFMPQTPSPTPYAPQYPIFTQNEKVYYYEDLSKSPIMCVIDEINADGTFEIVDLSDGRIIQTRIENLAKVFEPKSPSPLYEPNSPSPLYEPNSPSPRFSPHSPSPVYEPKSPSPRFSPHSPDMPEKTTIFDVEEEKTDKENEEDIDKDNDKNSGEKKIIINIKPE